VAIKIIPERPASMSHDIYSILKRFDSVAEGQDANQKSVPQLPALFKPRDISPVLGAPEKQHPTHDYFVGGESSELDEVSLGDYRTKALKQKAQSQMGAMFATDPEQKAKDLATFLKREKGLERVKSRDQAARQAAAEKEMANTIARLPELETEYEAMKQRYRSLGGSNWQYADREQNLTDREREARAMEGPMNNLWRQINAAKKAQGITEGIAKEDVVTKDRKSLGDYFQSVADAVKKDPALIDKVVQNNDMIGPAVKTITTDDGHEIKIHGNEDDGFRITVRNRPLKSTFKSLDEANMACEIFCNRRQQIDDSADYVEERA
jgi:hypothetical protein